MTCGVLVASLRSRWGRDGVRGDSSGARKEGRVVFYRLAEGFPEPLREHCLRRLIELSRTRADISNTDE
jgi:hypothetical protein